MVGVGPGVTVGRADWHELAKRRRMAIQVMAALFFMNDFL
jgi:hypothetical protein